MTYKELKLGKYQKMREVLKNEKEEINMQVGLLSILLDKTEDEILDMPLDEYQYKVSELSFLTKVPKVEPKCPNVLKLGGNEYYVTKNIEHISTSQYIDYQNFVKGDEDLAKILSCFVIPKGHKYCDDYDPLDVINTLREHLDVETAISICFFFRKQSLTSIKRTLRYLEWMMKTVKMTNKNQQIQQKLTEGLDKMKEMEALLEDETGFIGLT